MGEQVLRRISEGSPFVTMTPETSPTFQLYLKQTRYLNTLVFYSFINHTTYSVIQNKATLCLNNRTSNSEKSHRLPSPTIKEKQAAKRSPTKHDS
jgi:hypothetical protein